MDTIIRITDLSAPPHIRWAWRLSNDVGSPFYKRVDTGGRGQERTLIKFSGLRQSLELLIPPRYISSEEIDDEQGYLFVKNYWTVLQQEWPVQFEDKSTYKMMVNPGVRALSRLGRQLFKAKLDVQDFRVQTIEDYIETGKDKVNWAANGPLKDATGKGAEKRVFEQLTEWYGSPD